jgi:hypothetical protein
MLAEQFSQLDKLEIVPIHFEGAANQPRLSLFP